nr:hypothetical protein [Acinetobacter sp. Marseille-Q1620]
MANSARTINIQLTENSNSNRIKMLNGANGSAYPLFPGYPTLWDQYKALGIQDIRTHDWFGLSDFDTHIDKSNLSQPVYSVPSNNLDKAKSLMSSIANSRVLFTNYPTRSTAYDDSGTGVPMEGTSCFINYHYDNLGTKNTQILYRLGRSLGASNTPPDPDMFAKEASFIATYTNKYQDHSKNYQLRKPVTYFEIYNEPDVHDFYSGKPQDFYKLYAAAAKKIKQVDTNIQVGTCGVANPVADNKDYVDGLLDYCKKNNVPLDFYSWHHYCDGSSDPFDYYIIGRDIRKLLDSKGFNNTKSFLTEWNITPLVDVGRVSAVQTMQTASFICSALIMMQDAAIDKSYFYRADGLHLGLFNKEHKYTYAAKAFIAFEQMRETPYRLQVSTVGSGSTNPVYDYNQDTLGLVCLAGTDKVVGKTGFRKIKILISNYMIDRDYVSSDKYKFNQYSIDTSVTLTDALKSEFPSDGTRYYHIFDNNPYPSKINPVGPGGANFPKGALELQKLDYKDNNGLIINLSVPSSLGLTKYTANYSWLSNDGGITTSLDDEYLNITATPSESGNISNNSLTLNRPEFKEYQVLLIELDLS